MGIFKIIIGDITSDEILVNHDLIVNPTNPQMIAGAGVSGAIFKKAGVDELENFTQKEYDINYFSDNYNSDNIMNIGDIRVTPGFKLPMDIMFVQGPKEWELDNSFEILIKTYETMLNEIYKRNYKNVLIPSLGTGDYGFEHIKVGKKISTILNKFVKDKDLNIDLVLFNENDKKYYE